MSLFSTNFRSPELLSGYLHRIGSQRQDPSLTYLHQLIRNHQHAVPFENLSRIIDFWEKPEQFSTLPQSLEDICRGQGSVCWSHARSFKWLLEQLGFQASYLYMDPGHVCLKVSLDQDYYVEVGYAAPFFEAKPLHESFVIKSSSEEFHFQHRGPFVDVVRLPGPTKQLSLEVKSPQEIEAEFLKGNFWKTNRFLSATLIHKFIDGAAVRLQGQKLVDFRSGEKIESDLGPEEMRDTIRKIFQMDPELYFKALRYLEKEL